MTELCSCEQALFLNELADSMGLHLDSFNCLKIGLAVPKLPLVYFEGKYLDPSSIREKLDLGTSNDEARLETFAALRKAAELLLDPNTSFSTANLVNMQAASDVVLNGLYLVDLIPDAVIILPTAISISPISTLPEQDLKGKFLYNLWQMPPKDVRNSPGMRYNLSIETPSIRQRRYRINIPEQY